ncbi:redoxin domain-containing protein [bacterium]|nr:redoxin domain-containing protein [bacterium]
MRFSSGDPIPWFSARTHTTEDFQFSAAAGRYVILSFLGSTTRPDAQQVIADVEARRREFDDDRLCFFGVIMDPQDISSGCVREILPGIRYFQDFAGAISRAYDALPRDLIAANAQTDFRPFSLLLDTRLRVLQHFPLEAGGEGHVAKILDIARTLPDLGEQRPAEVQAPVLIVPRIFEPELCDELITYYHTHETEDSGFMRDQGGKTVGVYDYSTKRRRDCQIEDEDLRKRCMHRIHDRLTPEIRRAYQFNATRMERYIVACYEGETGGHFRAHRDNTTKGTAHRRFAVSVNLNADYEGGYVWFPEFGRHLFRPPAGGAVVFSCSLLHEATRVTSGTRYVFLPFLYDDAAAKLREENQQFLGGNINAPPGVSA